MLKIVHIQHVYQIQSWLVHDWLVSINAKTLTITSVLPPNIFTLEHIMHTSYSFELPKKHYLMASRAKIRPAPARPHNERPLVR